MALRLLLSFTLATAGCTGRRNSPSSEVAHLQGTWLLVYQEINGKKIPDEKAAEALHGRATFAGTKFRYTVELPGFDFEFSYKLDPSQTPKAIDLRLTNTPDTHAVGRNFVGIYRLNDKDLVICYSKTKRPSRFDAGQASGNQLIVLSKVERGG